MRFAVCLILMPALLNISFADERITIVHAGTLLAVPGEAPKTRQTITIEGNRITAIDDGFIDPASMTGELTFIDLADKFVLPGLMDMHVHLLSELGPNSRTEALQVTTSMQALKGALHAKRTLHAGFTTVQIGRASCRERG